MEGVDPLELDLPSWQIDEVRNRMKDYKDHPDQAMDFGPAIDEIEADL